MLKNEGIHTAIDTCGYVKREVLDMVGPYTDLFLYDLKAIDDDVHKRCTGVSNKLIIENLLYLDTVGVNIEIRIPYVPEYNSDQIEKMGAFLSTLKSVKAVKVLPYHNYAKSKYGALDMIDTSPEHLPEKSETEKARQILREYGLNVK
jgi:pyruvate formate lyase activating enzyme